MKVYNVQVGDRVVATSERQAEAYKFYADLVLLMPSSEIQVTESVKEERVNERFN